MRKITIGLTLLLGLFLTACGQKGALYLPNDTISQTPNGNDIDFNADNDPNDY